MLMTAPSLDRLFRPRSIAVIGATDRENAIGHLVMRNLLTGGFDGPIMPVHPGRSSVAGVLTYSKIADLPIAPDLAVVCTPGSTVPGILEQLGERGAGGAIVIAAGLSRDVDASGQTLQAAAMAVARKHGLRILGPNCLGLQVPGIGLNASFAHTPAANGKIAFLSQSGALCTVVLDWAVERGIGFSHFVSLGDCADVDFGDALDVVGADPATRAILLYIESIRERRNFMSAARAAARNKPVIVIKSGRNPASARAAATHTGALAGSDMVYDAAIRRAGMLRVLDIDELFAAVETLARAKPPAGKRLAILTNGGGIGVMALDALVARGGAGAELSSETIAALDRVLPPTWSRANPVDIIGDADAERYAKALAVLGRDPNADAVLVLHAPTAAIASDKAAKAVIETARALDIPVLTSWVGGRAVTAGRRLFADAAMATYDTPEGAVRAFMDVVAYRENQDLLMQTPAALATERPPQTDVARRQIRDVLAAGRTILTEPEAKAVLAAYTIPTIEAHVARSPDEAAKAATDIGFPVALKILSPDISHKSDVGGIDLFLDSAEGVRTAATAMLHTVRKNAKNARIEGFTVQRMAPHAGAFELLLGVTVDAVFGPVIMFGHGGTAVEVIADREIGLPPLNLNLALDLIGRTRVARLLKGYRDRPPADLQAIARTLVHVSQLIIDIPEIVELDINPLFADQNGVVAVDARIKIAPAEQDSLHRFAIRPYPQDLEETFVTTSGRAVVIRPIRPEDEIAHYAFLSQVTPEDIRFRFFGTIKELPHTEMARFTQIDYHREMAFIATAPKKPDGESETLGVVRTVADPDNIRAEFAILIRSDVKGQGLGYRMLEKMIAYCRARGTKRIVGQVSGDNQRMLELVRTLGFSLRPLAKETATEVTLEL
jgi:acetyltransferase